MRKLLRKLLAVDDSEVVALRNQRDYLIRTIRDMDQEIWNMSQRTSWEAQRPHFNKLMEGTIARKHAENERINALVTEQIKETYTPPSTMKQLRRF